MANKPKKEHPEHRGERNPLTSRKLRQRLRENRFVPKKLDRSVASEAGTDIDLPPGSKPDVPAQPSRPVQPPQPPQPAPGQPVPLR